MELLINGNVVAAVVTFVLMTLSGLVVFTVKSFIRLHDVEQRQDSSEDAISDLVNEMKEDRKQRREESSELRKELHNLAIQIAESNRRRA